jgi:hypothetical protein
VVAGHASTSIGECTCAASFLRIGCLLALLVLGCGHSSSVTTHAAARPASPCLPAARATVASYLRAASAAVGTTPGISNSAVPQCVFRAGKVRVTALVDSGAQPFFRLERTIVEDSQQFSTVRLEPAPEHVSQLGLDAAWFPGEQQVMTTDGRRLITAAVDWPGVPGGRRRALATAVARMYLGPQRPKAASGYPSG